MYYVVLNDHILTVAAVQEQRTTRQRQYLDEIILLRVASSDASRNDEYINSLLCFTKQNHGVTVTSVTVLAES